jgi:hypothetical protein
MGLKTWMVIALLGGAFMSCGSAYSATKAKIKKPVTAENEVVSIPEPKPPIIPREPIEFRGIPLGSGENVVTEKFPELSCYPRNSPFADRYCYVQSECHGYKYDDYKGHSDCLANPAKVWNYGGYKSDVYVWFINNALVRVSISFHVNLYQRILGALVTKYGKPDDTKTEEVQNKMGAKFDNEISSWNVSGVTLTINKYGDDLTKSSVLYSLDSSIQDMAERRKKENEATAKSL